MAQDKKSSTRPSETDDPIVGEAANALSVLQVIQRLEVGPIRIEPKRVVAPYLVVQDNKRDTFEFIYHYEETVFDPNEPESQNLADMLAVQAALNYGLFCQDMVFHGTFDTLDRRFLRAMAENTAREIYVKKFLEPNAFLQGAVRKLPALRQPRYLQARLRFSDRSKSKSDRWKMWSTRRQGCCVLSSGGKDSLLSFALMREILGTPVQEPQDVPGEVHPIFVNESGRHWFTALNAYRHFQRDIPHTSRVWVNSDRLFAFMLRHLPFIRPDFANIRSDEYPIRLWTVAVFLFGVLPLMRKRGLGRLVVGDEYDTTVRAAHQGIRHYDGLFDQSLHFDQALSAYFMQKGWAISQFSILRPLSELLIESILAHRYPQLQALQVSCHAASKAGQSVVPCGRCEKCRRIVGMLTAIGADPRQCGYTAKQIESCLQRIVTQGVHQEPPGARHLLYLLTQKGALQLPPDRLEKAKEHPEILKLRFDPERSPIQAIPMDLREPLIRILSQHARGALLRTGRRWREVDPLTLPGLIEPYPYEFNRPHDKTAGRRPASGNSDGHCWGTLTWPEIQAYLRQVDIALLPVGAIEQHGPHLPLDTDTFDADYLARRVAEACTDPKPLVLPVIPYGVSYHHNDFKGTLSINNESLSRLIYDIGMSVAANGINKLVIINGHGGNSPALNYAAQMINRDAHIFVCVDTGETSDVDIAALVDTPNDVHAGEIETSTSLAVRPHLVRHEHARREIPRFSSRYLDFTSKRGVAWYAYTDKISESGIMGDALRADAQKGQKIWEIMIAHLVALVEDIKQMTLDEIHHRRY